MQERAFFKYSVFALAVAMGAPLGARGAVRITNSPRTMNYMNGANYTNVVNSNTAVNTTPQMANVPAAETANTTTDVELPIRVANRNLADQISRGTANITVADLQQCASIYPDGEFAWDAPTLGVGAGGAATCVAVVELRGYQMGANGEDVVFARASLPSGSAVKCNISEFPETTYTNAVGEVVFPADTEPTVDDVISVMNDEQKKNAGWKIAAGTILGGIGGNMIGKNAPGHDGLLGGGRAKTNSTIVGALTGGALAAGSAYTGKVAGDTILSTGVNAAFGSVIGNVFGAMGSNSVLRVERCKVPNESGGTRETSCLYGIIEVSAEDYLSGDKANHTLFYNISGDKPLIDCDENMENCETVNEQLTNIVLDAYSDTTLEKAISEEFTKIKINGDNQYWFDETSNVNDKHMVQGGSSANDGGIYAKVTRANKISQTFSGLIADVSDKALGLKLSDWIKLRGNIDVSKMYQRGGNDTGIVLPALPDGQAYTLDMFKPLSVDAEDGGIIDFSNRARTKATLIGAGAGGAMGAFAGYQNAQNDVDARWVSAVREYKDSLTKFYCATGNRFLSSYNDTASINSIQN